MSENDEEKLQNNDIMNNVIIKIILHSFWFFYNNTEYWSHSYLIHDFLKLIFIINILIINLINFYDNKYIKFIYLILWFSFDANKNLMSFLWAIILNLFFLNLDAWINELLWLLWLIN